MLDSQRIFRLFIPLLVSFLCIIQHGMSVMTSTAVLEPSKTFKTTTWTHQIVKKTDLNLKEKEGVLRLKGIMKCYRNLKFVSGWSDIGYSFLVGQDGNIYEGRGWHHVGAHTKGHNSRGFAASFMGNFTTHLPNAASLNATKLLIACGIQKGFISHSYVLYGHRDKGNTTCPGDRLYHEIRSWPHYNHTHPWRFIVFSDV